MDCRGWTVGGGLSGVDCRGGRRHDPAVRSGSPYQSRPYRRGVPDGRTGAAAVGRPAATTVCDRVASGGALAHPVPVEPAEPSASRSQPTVEAQRTVGVTVAELARHPPWPSRPEGARSSRENSGWPGRRPSRAPARGPSPRSRGPGGPAGTAAAISATTQKPELRRGPAAAAARRTPLRAGRSPWPGP